MRPILWTILGNLQGLGICEALVDGLRLASPSERAPLVDAGWTARSTMAATHIVAHSEKGRDALGIPAKQPIVFSTGRATAISAARRPSQLRGRALRLRHNRTQSLGSNAS